MSEKTIQIQRYYFQDETSSPELVYIDHQPYEKTPEQVFDLYREGVNFDLYIDGERVSYWSEKARFIREGV